MKLKGFSGVFSPGKTGMLQQKQHPLTFANQLHQSPVMNKTIALIGLVLFLILFTIQRTTTIYFLIRKLRGILDSFNLLIRKMFPTKKK